MAKKVEREPTRREIKKVIAATNNHYKGQAAVNAIDLKRLLGVKKCLRFLLGGELLLDLDSDRIRVELISGGSVTKHLRCIPSCCFQQDGGFNQEPPEGSFIRPLARMVIEASKAK
jgi:hypothetical protein